MLPTERAEKDPKVFSSPVMAPDTYVSEKRNGEAGVCVGTKTF